jgi:putative oxidoreductase
MYPWLDDLGKLVLRLGFGILFLLHGLHKFLDHPQSLVWIEGLLREAGLPTLLAWGVYAGELLAPLMIILGFFARIGAALTTITLIFALYLVHIPQWLQLTATGGWALELQGMFLLASIALLLLGPGRFSLNGR